MVPITCIRCGSAGTRSPHSKNSICLPCQYERVAEARKAIAQVKKEIYHKRIEKPTVYRCVDCGGQASQYEHRDYTKPLDVVPICRSCNHMRGPGLDSVLRSIPSKQAA